MLQSMVWSYPRLDSFVYDRACSLQPSASKAPDLQRIERYVVGKLHAWSFSQMFVQSACLVNIFKRFPCLHTLVLVLITWGSQQSHHFTLRSKFFTVFPPYFSGTESKTTNLHGGVQVFLIFLGPYLHGPMSKTTNLHGGVRFFSYFSAIF